MFIKLVRGRISIIFFQNLSGLWYPTIMPNFVEIRAEIADLFTFFEICMAPYGSDIYKDCPKKSTSGVGIINSSTKNNKIGAKCCLCTERRWQRHVKNGLHQCDIHRPGTQGRRYILLWLASVTTVATVPAIHHVSSEFIFVKTVPQNIGHAMFSDINISQGSVATPLRCGRMCSDLLTANFLVTITIKHFLKIGQYLAKLWRTIWCHFLT